MNISRRHKIKTINKKDEIKYILNNGKKIYTKLGPIFLYLSKENSFSKTAILLKRNCGTAVKRNYIKRIFKNYIKDVFSNSEKYNRLIFIYGYKNKVNYDLLVSELQIIKNYL